MSARKEYEKEPMKLKDLQALPDGAKVWVTYKQRGDSGYRINDEQTVCHVSVGDYWTFEYGDFTPESYDPESVCEAEQCGEGIMRVFKRIQKGTP